MITVLLQLLGIGTKIHKKKTLNLEISFESKHSGQLKFNCSDRNYVSEIRRVIKEIISQHKKRLEIISQHKKTYALCGRLQ